MPHFRLASELGRKMGWLAAYGKIFGFARVLKCDSQSFRLGDVRRNIWPLVGQTHDTCSRWQVPVLL